MLTVQGGTALLLITSMSLFAADQTIRARLLSIPSGTPVEARLVNKQKLRGKLGAVTDSTLTLQTIENGRIVDKPIALDELRSVKVKTGMSTAAKVGIGVAAGAGALIVAMVIAVKASGW